MKTHIFRPLIALVLTLSAGLMPGSGMAATFTNTPSVVSNSYTGTITLLISNVPTGDTVVVQKFMDINTNGVIDAGDLLVQQFTLTDGQPGQVIGGVTNYNVPGDLNVATGAITATLNFNNGDFIQNLAAKYFYKLSSPAGHFAPLTNSLTVTNFPYGQGFSGNVVSNSSSTKLPFAQVVLFPGPRPGHDGPGQPLGGTVANSAGAYTISAPAGTYTLLAFDTNYISNFQKAPVIILASSVSVITNLSLTNATTSISGSIVDAASPATVLPGVFIPVESTNNQLAVVFSDTNGNYTARVTPGQWSLGSDDSGLIVHGYVGYNNAATNVVAPATGVTLAFPKANALFYGTVTNSQGVPFVGIDVNADDTTSNLYNMDGYTDMNGRYFTAALGTGVNDPWELGFSSESTGIYTNYIFSVSLSSQNNGTNLTAGTAVLQNFNAIIGTNAIFGTVKDTGGNPITNVQVYAYANIGNFSYQSETNTDNNGNYAVNVANGIWNVSVYCGGGDNSLPTNYICPNQITLNIANNNVPTNFVVQACNGVLIGTTSPLPAGEVNVPYFQSFSASSCYPSFTWTNTSGNAALPPGLTFYSNGQLSGTPTANGVYMFTAKVADGINATSNRTYSVTIYNEVQVTTTSLPNGTNGYLYSQQLAATGGQVFGGASPYSWSLSSGSLPANLNLATNGVISGTAATSGTFDFSVQAMDQLGGTWGQGLALTLDANGVGTPPTVGITPAAGQAGQVLVYYPSSGSNFTLQTTTNLVTGPWVTASNGVPAISLLFTNTGPQQFFRLH